MAREGEPKITFCAFSLRTRLRARRFAAVALSSAGVAGFSTDVAVGFVMIGRLTQLWTAGHVHTLYININVISMLCLALSFSAQAETKAGQQNENEKRCQR